MSESMRAAVRGLAQRCPVCVVSGRDRRVVQDLMGVEDLIVAGSHGFDIWSRTEGTLEHEAGGGFEELIERVTERVREEADLIEGQLVEPNKASVALHYRLVADTDRPAIKPIVDRVLAEHPGELKVTPGKMVYEIQPKLEWDKGKAVLYLLDALRLDGDDVAPLYLGDDVTDEDAFRALSGRGIGIFVGRADDPELEGRGTSAAFVLDSIARFDRGGGTIPGPAGSVSERRLDEAFALAYESFEPRDEGLREALTSTRNGYFCTRGAAEWQDADGVHYPGTYAHGAYNRETTVMGGRPVLNRTSSTCADIVMLFYRFSESQLRHLFEQLGYEFGPETARKNIAYYDARTSHGSTLSFITHAAVLASLDPESSWERFIVALESDIGDVQGGTTKEGIHLGVMAGTLDLIQRGYIGSDIRDGVLHFNPRLTERLEGLSFPMQFRGTPIRVTLADGGLTVVAHTEGFSRPIRIAVGDEVCDLCAGDHHTFALKPTTSVTR